MDHYDSIIDCLAAHYLHTVAVKMEWASADDLFVRRDWLYPKLGGQAYVRRTHQSDGREVYYLAEEFASCLWGFVFSSPSPPTFYFKRELDAVEFKLRFG